MKVIIAAAALLFLAAPAWAQDAASPAQHHPQAPSPSAAPSDKVPDTASGQTDMKMGMMEHCKMMQKQKSGNTMPMDQRAGKDVDCAAMHNKMHSSDSTAPGH